MTDDFWTGFVLALGASAVFWAVVVVVLLEI